MTNNILPGNHGGSRPTLRWAVLDESLPPGIHTPKLDGDVGWDLEAMEDVTIFPGKALDIPINVRLHLPKGVWAEIRGRSSIARRGLQVDAGTIDTGYRGPLYVLARNTKVWQPGDPTSDEFRNENAVRIKAGERVGQVVFYNILHMGYTHVAKDDFDSDTERGENGFGSTGK